MTVKIAPKTALLQLLFGLSACDISPPQLPQHRQQQKHNPTIGIIIMNKNPRPTQIVIPRAYPKATWKKTKTKTKRERKEKTMNKEYHTLLKS